MPAVRVEMLAVGKELLIGRTLNTNALWIGKRLSKVGSMLAQVNVVDDDLGEIESGLRDSVRRKSDFVVVVGGLGPTPDDMTLAGVARTLGVGLKRNPIALEMLKEHYARRGLGHVELTPARLKMCRLPEGAAPLRNEVGTAPGVRLSSEGTVIFCLPGVPSEMRGIYSRSVEPEILSELGEIHTSYMTLKLVGVLESALAPVIARELRRHPGAYIKSHPKGMKDGISRVELDIAAVDKESGRAEGEVAAIAMEMRRSISKQGGKVASARKRRG